jgi:diguanylate cyclase (GGDEF)-like protein
MGEISFQAIDIPTLAFSRGLIQIMLGGLLLYLGDQDQGARGARLWAVGFFFNGVSLLLFPLQLPDGWLQAATVVNHMALGLSSAFFLTGFWKFGEQPRRTWILVLLISIPALSLLAWELVWPNARLRILTTASGQALFLLMLQQTLRTPPRPEVGVIYRRLRHVVIAYLLLVIWSYGSLAGLLPTTAKTSLDYHRLLFSGGSLLFMLSLAVGCLALQFALLAARSADLAKTDWLTGLPNRRGFFQAVAGNHLLNDGADPSGVIALDIDHFKRINDRYGHAVGDQVLQAFGGHLRALTDQSQLLARMGGEEFCIVLPGQPRSLAQALAEKVRKRCMEHPVVISDGEPIRFTVSAGVTETMPWEDFEKALAKADQALYRAKENGRAQVVVV